MKVLDLEQGTPEWLAARAGMVTASRIEDVLAKIKTGEAAARRDYRSQLVAEILTGKPQENGYQSPEMIWGNETEPLARSAFELSRNVLVDQVGFVYHPSIERAGASPDGLVGDDGLIEIKCPKTSTHLQYLLDGVVPAKYQPQMQFQMACTGRKWCVFVSHDPRLPEKLNLFIATLPRDEKRIEQMEEEVKQFLGEIDRALDTLKNFHAAS